MYPIGNVVEIWMQAAVDRAQGSRHRSGTWAIQMPARDKIRDMDDAKSVERSR